MKISMFLKLTLSLLATTQIAFAGDIQGIYSVSNSDGDAVYPAKIEFNGSNLNNSTKLTVMPPVTVSGNFELVRAESGFWKSNSSLVDQVDCGSDSQFDFICHFDFNDGGVVLFSGDISSGGEPDDDDDGDDQQGIDSSSQN